MSVLVTGAAGFIGHAVCERLLAEGKTVIGIDNLNAYYDPRLKATRLERLQAHKNFTFTRLDIADGQAVHALFAATKPETVIHLAAQAGVRYSLEAPHDYVASNVTGFLNILEACRAHPVRHLVFASSSSVYGANTQVPFSTAHHTAHPVSLYAATKKAGEQLAHSYSHLFTIPTTGLRFFTVYGPWGRPDMAYFKFAEAILAGKPIDVYNQGEMQRDFTYIDDIATGILATADRVPAPSTSPSPGPDESAVAPYRLYNIGNHTPVKLTRMIDVLEEALGQKAIRVMKPMQPGDVTTTWADVSQLQADTGFSPATPIEEGLRRFAAWFLEWRRAQ